jgi:SAM-dependent methyltransferase
MTGLRTAPEWVTEQLMRIGDVEFYLTVGLDELHAHQSDRNHFLLGKTRPMIEDVLALRERERIEKILDVGIFKGGSAVLYTKLFEPAKLVAIEYLPKPVDALTQFIADNDLGGRLIPYYGTDQSDQRAMARILADEFPARDIDLVVDDASHFYFESRATVNLALPYLRPNGVYIIEDWGWAHWPGDVWQKSQAIASLKPALSNLLIELLMLCASRPDIVSNISVTQNTAMLRRGDAALEPGEFDIGRHYLCRDRWFKPML